MSVAAHRSTVNAAANRPKRSSLRSWLAAALVMFAECAFAVSAFAQESDRKVLALYSMRRDAQFTAVAEFELSRALDAGLKGHLDYHSESIDAARFPEAAYRTAFADFLRVKYQGTRFDLVIAMGDAAVELVTSNRSGLFRDAPLVFFSNNRQVRGGPNATGLIVQRNFAATLPLIEKLQPDVAHLFVVSGAAPADRSLEQEFRAQLGRTPSRLTTTYLSGLSIDALERRLATRPPRSAVFYLLVSQDGAGNRMHPLHYVDRVTAASAGPVYSWVDSALDHGIVGGSLYSQQAATTRVAQLALRVLRGERAGSIPRSVLDLNVEQVDWRQLRRWGIDDSRIPTGTVVHFRELGIWGRYKAYVIAAAAVLLLQTVLIAGLLVQREQAQRAQRDLRRRQADLQVSYQRIRDLGGRLFLAQEAERARIAHELHDDISQQLSLLAIHLDMLRDRVRGAPKELIDEASSRAESIVNSVHDLSRRLHPHKLRLLGLVSALQDLRNEVSQAGMRVTFTHDNVPAKLPPDLTLCLFRIAQEALQNALKHSHARTVSMRLTGGPTEIVLAIADDGIGFNVDAAWGNGLGLVGMRERLDAVGGTFEVQSTPGAGTTLTIRAARTVIEETQASPAFDSLEQTPHIA